MGNLVETTQWEGSVDQIENTDPVVGGASGIANVQAVKIANRTQWLKQQVDAINAILVAIDAETLDGIDSSKFLRSDVVGIVTADITIQGTKLTKFTAADTDIVGFLGGTVTGTLLEGPGNEHFVIGLRSNDSNDAFAILADENADGTYTKMLFRVRSDGQIETDGNKIWHEGNDGAGSGLDANKVDGRGLSTTAAGDTVVSRDSLSDIHARMFRSEFDTTNAAIGFIMTQVNTGSDNFLRPSTPAQLRAALNVEEGATADLTPVEILAKLLTVDGIGSLLTGDLLDGLDSTQFLRSDVPDSAAEDITIQGTKLTRFTASNTDITGFLGGTSTGSLLESPDNDHFVIGLKSNDGADAFAVLADENADGTYTKMLFRVRSDGGIETDGNKIWHEGTLAKVSQGEAEAGTSTTYRAWSAQRVRQAIDIGVPVGNVLTFASSNLPAGYLKCNGGAVSRTTYSQLFTALGTLYGVGNGSTTFNLPDFRGEFVRGWDDGRGIDGGRAIGSFQSDEFKSHSHEYHSGNGTGTHSIGDADGNPALYSHSTDNTGGSETRPRNVAMLICIKY